MRRLATAAVLLAAVAGCGDDGKVTADTVKPPPLPTGTVATPARSPTTTATPTATAPSGTVPVPPIPTTTSESKGGDEEPIRVPALFEVSEGKAQPAEVTVPAFLGIELLLVPADGKAHEVTLGGTPDPVTVKVSGKEPTTRKIAGLKPGKYALTVDGESSGAVLVVTDKSPGP